jgi:hypothetical protein
MPNSYSSLCDDFFVDMYINTELELPSQRDTILAFFEQVQKRFGAMGNFYRRENNEYYLEEDRRTGHYRWVSLEPERIGAGVINPDTLEEAYELDRLVLGLVPHMLSVSHLDIDSLDVTFAMDFDCAGSHDQVISEALLDATAFGSLLDLPGARAIDVSPSVVISLSEDMQTQARIAIESRTSIFDPSRKREIDDEPISLSFTIRQYPSPEGKFDALKSFENQARLAEELMAERVIPKFVQPLINTIAEKGLA